jgi:LuxR family transcriptional regulator, quorum-sensing system regulator BjaR1
MILERPHRLSGREREMLLWACRGKTYAEIAEIVGLSNGSVKTYLDHARYKLNVVNLPQACAVAVALGTLSPEEILRDRGNLPDLPQRKSEERPV